MGTDEDAKTVSALQVPSDTDKEALLKRVEKLMLESKHMDQLDREDSDDIDESDADEDDVTNNNVSENLGSVQSEPEVADKKSLDVESKKSDNIRRVSFATDVDVREISPSRKITDPVDSGSSESTEITAPVSSTSTVASLTPSDAVKDDIVERSFAEIETERTSKENDLKSTKPVSLFKKNRKR